VVLAKEGKMKKAWDWTLGLWTKLNTHAKWMIAIVAGLLVYNFLIG
jgi:hypothetical protein